MKLNLIGIGPIASEIINKMKSDDCIIQSFPDNIAGEDLQSNEAKFIENSTSPNADQYSETYCFVEGKLGISGITLALLEQYKYKPITIIYIKDDLLSSYHKKNDEISFNVLQEYARSGVFRSLIIFDYNKMLNDMLLNSYTNIDPINVIIDKIIFGVHIYWRLVNEKYLEGSKVDFDDTIYKISTFYEVIETENDLMLSSYYDITFSKQSVFVISSKNNNTREQLLRTMRLKKLAKSNNSDIVLLKDDIDFALVLMSSNIIQESIYTK